MQDLVETVVGILYPEEERKAKPWRLAEAFRKKPEKATLGLEHKWVWQDPALDIIYMRVAPPETEGGEGGPGLRFFTWGIAHWLDLAGKRASYPNKLSSYYYDKDLSSSSEMNHRNISMYIGSKRMYRTVQVLP
jgi:hypothetical protein